MKLVVPAEEHLASYVAALRSGWSPDNIRGRAAAEEQLLQIQQDPAAFLALLDNPLGGGPAVTLADGSTVQRLPSISRWMWDGEFAGTIGLRWQPGTAELPPTCLGHIGFSVVPWKRRRSYARQALGDVLGEARARGLDYVEITTTPDNLASQKVIEANGGEFIERFTKRPELGGGESFRYHIGLATETA